MSRLPAPTLVLAPALLLAAFAGCLGGDGDAAVYVKDATNDDFRHVNVTISKVDVHRAGGDNSSGWETITEESRTVDLLAFSDDDSRALLGEAGLAPGRYTQVRLHVAGASGVSTEGESVPITVVTTPLKVVRSFNVSSGETTRVIVDIDLERSLKRSGTDGGWKLTPVVGKVLVEEDASGAEGDVADEGEDGSGDSAGGAADGGAGDGAPSGGPGYLATYVKDAATDAFAEIWITFTEVTVHAAGGDGNNTTDEDGGWTVVSDGERSVNLMNFSAQGSKAFLGNATLASGRYTQVRLNVSEAWGVDADGNRTNFTVTNPSVKVVRTFNVTEGDTTELVIDVDLDRSVHEQGGASGGWRLAPVIGKVLVEEDVGDDPGEDVPDGP